jgi:cell wall-associated NlpC family hydrolase
MRGSDVREAQTLLAAHGFSPGAIDGIFGQRTHASVVAFQKTAFPNAPREWDGIIEPRTWAALDAPPHQSTVISQFIDYLKGEVKNGSIYVWGAQGQKDVSEVWIRRMETTTRNADRAIAFWKRQIDRGFDQTLRAFDCSGLIMYFLNREGLYKGDLSSRGLFAKCVSLKREELLPGDLVFRHNGLMIHHVGVFAGDHAVVEAMGRDDGVVLRDINSSGSAYWNRYGRLSLLERRENANE